MKKIALLVLLIVVACTDPGLEPEPPYYPTDNQTDVSDPVDIPEEPIDNPEDPAEPVKPLDPMVNPEEPPQAPIEQQELEPAQPSEIACGTDSQNCVVAANNEFAIDIFNELDTGENLFISPWSISSALGITYEGARGKTAEEMADVLHIVNKEDRLEGFRSLSYEFNKNSPNYELSTANALWAEQSYGFASEYVDTVVDNYLSEANNVDFLTEAEKTRKDINEWVEDKTNDKIKDLLPSGTVDSYTRLVITNAVYFKGTWVYEFDKKQTFEQPFDTGSGQVTVDMMQRKETMFNYAEIDDMQVLEMDYEGDELSMLILLPDDIASLDLAKLPEYKSQLQKQEVNVFLPKFKFETKYFMGRNLVNMGMPIAFSEAADFSGMTGNKDLFIGDVVHQGFIDVNEEGTEAAAATGVVIGITSVRPVYVFMADHPFVFIIQHKGTGQVLFVGKVVDPTA